MMRAYAGILLALALSVPAWALDREEVISLTRAGVGAEVILEQLRASGVPAPLAAADLLAMHQAGVADEVVREMIRLGKPGAASTGSLRLTNEDTDRFCILRKNAGTFLLYAGYSEMNPSLSREETRDFTLPPGRYRLSWFGESDGVVVQVEAGRTIHVVARESVHELVKVLHADVYDGDRFVETRPLRVFPLYYRPRPEVPCAECAAERCGEAAPTTAASESASQRSTFSSERVSGYADH